MGGGTDLQRLSGAENCVLGMVTGIMSKACNYPFLSWKNTVQQGLPISFNPAVVYRGLPMACLNLGGTTAVQFGTVGFFQRLLAGPGGLKGDTVQVGGALLGGAASGIPCSIWELCMIQQQRFGGSMLGTPAQFIREYGYSSLGRGATMTVGRESMFTMAMLGMTPVIQRKLMESGNDENTALAAGSLIGACFAGTITHPMDTIKTCMQGDLGGVKYKGIMETGSLLAEEYGVVQGLFKGLTYRIALISTTFFLVNTFKGKLVPFLFPHAVAGESEK
jgi:solute carrier family 25 carnitine/acylcarnitine transporter 20/29